MASNAIQLSDLRLTESVTVLFNLSNSFPYIVVKN